METVRMNEFKRTAMSLRRMFGSSRTWFAFLAILLVCGVGYLISNHYLDRSRGLRAADELWNRDQNVEAVREYKTLLSDRDPLNKQYAVILGNIECVCIAVLSRMRHDSGIELRRGIGLRKHTGRG